MKTDQFALDNPRLQSAVSELQDLIRQRYPAATFNVDRGEDPAGVYVTVTVDVDDIDDVVDVYIDRLVTLRVEEGLPLHVVPVRPIERVVAQVREQQRSRAGASARLAR